MAFDRQAALDAGYTEAEIDAYLQGQDREPAPAPVAPGEQAGEPPAPTTEVEQPGSMAGGAATVGMGLAHAAVPLALGYGVGKYGGRGIEAVKNLVQGGGANAARVPTTAPVNPAAINVGNPAVSPSYSAPAAPAAQQAQQNMVQRGMQYADKVRQIAMEKVMQTAQKAAPIAQAARPVAPAALGIGGMLYSGGLNAGEEEELRRRRMMPPTIR